MISLPLFLPDGVSAGFDTFHRSLLTEPGQHPLDGWPAYIRAGLRQIGIAERDRKFQDCRNGHFSLSAVGSRQFAGSTLKLPVCCQQHHTQKVFPPGQQSVFTLMPVLGGFVERIVITSKRIVRRSECGIGCLSRNSCSNEFIDYSNTILSLPGSLPLVSSSRYSSNLFFISAGVDGEPY